MNLFKLPMWEADLLSNSGVRVVVNNYIRPYYKTYQFRFPISKKKRIRSKWSKRRINFKTVLVDNCYMIGNTIVVSQKQYDMLNSFQDGQPILSH